MKIEDLIPTGWAKLNLGDILKDKSKIIDPGKFPDQIFELYSIPNHAIGQPEIIKGREIGSSKRTVESGVVLVSKINPRINRVWIVEDFRGYPKIASTEWITFFNNSGIFNKFLFYILKQNSFKNYLANNVSGVGGSLMRVNKTVVSQFPFPLPPLPEQHRIVAKIEALFTQLDKGVEQLTAIQRQLKTYRQSVLKAAFEGKLTAAWRERHNPPPAEELLAQIRSERQQAYDQATKDWKTAVKAWEADGKKGTRPARPQAPKAYEPLTAEELGELGELPEGWKISKLGNISSIIGGVTKGRKLDDQRTIELPYLRVANVQDGYLDLSIIKTIDVLPEDLEKYRLLEGDILYTEGGDKDKLGRGSIWKNEIQDCIHQNHIFRARVFQNRTLPQYIALFSQTQTAKDYFFRNAKQTVNLASINLTVLSNLPVPIPTTIEQHQIVQAIESRLSLCDQLERAIATGLQQAETLRQSILKKAFEGRLVPQDPNDPPASELLERIRKEKGK